MLAPIQFAVALFFCSLEFYPNCFDFNQTYRSNLFFRGFVVCVPNFVSESLICCCRAAAVIGKTCTIFRKKISSLSLFYTRSYCGRLHSPSLMLLVFLLLSAPLSLCSIWFRFQNDIFRAYDSFFLATMSCYVKRYSTKEK